MKTDDVELQRRYRLLECAIQNTSSSREMLLFLIEMGLLAPSTHNTQPWIFDINEANRTIDVRLDTNMKLEQADASMKYMYISTGAFLENIAQTCKACGLSVVIDIKGKDDVVARISIKGQFLVSESSKSMLVSIVERQNFRGFFAKKVDVEPINTDAVGVKTWKTCADENIEALARLTAVGLRSAYKNKSFRHEIAGVIKPNNSKETRGLFGFALRMSQLQSIIVPKLMRRLDIGSKLAKMNYKSFTGSSAVVVLSTSSMDRQSLIDCGRQLERQLLAYEQAGLRTSIFVASLESDDSRSEVKRILAIPHSETLHILFCVGFAEDRLRYSPRTPAAAMLAK